MNSTPPSGSVQRVACLGLGAMGAPIAANLLKHGHEVHVWNRTPAKAAPLQALGARVLPAITALREVDADYVFTNVSDSRALRAIVSGEHGLASSLRAGATVIDNSSVDPDVAREIASQFSAQRIAFLDAPVTGGTSGAQAGTLTVMIGGDREVAARAEPLIRAFASAIFYVGSAGSGQACKLCHQVAAACAMLGVCEGLALAAKAQLPLRTVLDVLSAGSAGSAITRTQGAKILASDHTPGFRVDLMRKDLRSAHAFAGALALPLPGSELVASMLTELSQTGGGDLGWQALIREFERTGDFRLPAQT